MEQRYSMPVDWVGEEHLGFVINAEFSPENSTRLTEWLDGLSRKVPHGLYTMDSHSLHITVLDWVAPLF